MDEFSQVDDVAALMELQRLEVDAVDGVDALHEALQQDGIDAVVGEVHGGIDLCDVEARELRQDLGQGRLDRGRAVIRRGGWHPTRCGRRGRRGDRRTRAAVDGCEDGIASAGHQAGIGDVAADQRLERRQAIVVTERHDAQGLLEGADQGRFQSHPTGSPVWPVHNLGEAVALPLCHALPPSRGEGREKAVARCVVALARVAEHAGHRREQDEQIEIAVPRRFVQQQCTRHLGQHHCVDLGALLEEHAAIANDARRVDHAVERSVRLRDPATECLHLVRARAVGATVDHLSLRPSGTQERDRLGGFGVRSTAHDDRGVVAGGQKRRDLAPEAAVAAGDPIHAGMTDARSGCGRAQRGAGPLQVLADGLARELAQAEPARAPGPGGGLSQGPRHGLPGSETRFPREPSRGQLKLFLYRLDRGKEKGGDVVVRVRQQQQPARLLLDAGLDGIDVADVGVDP